MTGRIAFLFLAIVVLASPQPVNAQRAENFNGFQLVDKQAGLKQNIIGGQHVRSRNSRLASQGGSVSFPE